jgi:hypothetical protein
LKRRIDVSNMAAERAEDVGPETDRQKTVDQHGGSEALNEQLSTNPDYNHA